MVYFEISKMIGKYLSCHWMFIRRIRNHLFELLQNGTNSQGYPLVIPSPRLASHSNAYAAALSPHQKSGQPISFCLQRRANLRSQETKPSVIRPEALCSTNTLSTAFQLHPNHTQSENKWRVKFQNISWKTRITQTAESRLLYRFDTHGWHQWSLWGGRFLPESPN